MAGFEMMRLFNPLKFFSDVALNFGCFIFRLCFGMDVCHGDFQQEELMTSNEILTYIFLDLEFPVQGISLISSFLFLFCDFCYNLDFHNVAASSRTTTFHQNLYVHIQKSSESY